MSKIIMIGLDGLDSDLVYSWKNDLSNISKVMRNGGYGRIESTVPPITPSAWACVLTGKNPGQYGFWNFTYRRDFSYGEPFLVNSNVIKSDTLIYRIIPRYGKKVAIINVPVTYPAPEVPNGYSISGFMTPSLDECYTYPLELKNEIKNILTENYIIDVCVKKKDFRQSPKGALDRIYKMDTQRFKLLKYFIQNENCDFILCDITGTNRMSHLFYRYFDEKHVRYVPNSEYKNVLKNHYMFCDKNIGEILDIISKKINLIIISAYSIQRLDGRINLNEWLIQEGYMKLNKIPKKPMPISKLDVNWSNTKAWATGCMGQIYLNVKGRESHGVVGPKEYDELLDELAAKLIRVSDQKGNRLDTKIIRRKDIHFGEFAEYGPDLFVYFDSCRWSTNELVGYDSIYSYDTLKGPNNAGYGPYGFFAMYGPDIPEMGEMSDLKLIDVAPTVLRLLGIRVPIDMEGKALVKSKKEEEYSEENKELIRKRLRNLGYF